MRKKIILFIIFASIFCINNVSATTLKEYEDAVAKYTAELKEKEAKLAKNAEEIVEVKKNIEKITGQIKTTEDEIVKLQEEIEKSNQEIEKKTAESKKIMEYYQLENGDNAYLEYAFGAETITDMVYRISIIEQLTEYNDKIMKELKQLIDENTRKKDELDKKNKELEKLKKDLQSEKERIEADSAKVSETIPDTKGQINLYQNRVNYYKSKGCKSEDIIGVTCDIPKPVVKKSSSSSSSSSSGSNVGSGPLIGANGFRFPVDGGGISWGYGGAHKGVDITKNRTCNAPIYAVAPGRVYYVGNGLDVYGAYMVMIVHNVNGNLVFSQYAHVQRNIPVSVGQDVDTDTVIAYMGSTGYSTGCHLHLEMSTSLGWGYNATYNSYIKRIINPFTYVPSP